MAVAPMVRLAPVVRSLIREMSTANPLGRAADSRGAPEVRDVSRLFSGSAWLSPSWSSSGYLAFFGSARPWSI